VCENEVLYIRKCGEVAQTLRMKNFGHHPTALVDVAAEVNFLDKRQQAEFVQRCEWIEILPCCHSIPLSEIQGMVEVGGGHGIPGETGGCTCFEARSIVDEVGDDHFQKFVGKLVRLSMCRGM